MSAASQSSSPGQGGRAKKYATREEKMWREVTTPEGAVIRMRLADASERAVALLIDAAIMLVTLILGLLAIRVGISAGFGGDWDVLSSILFTFFFFLLRGFYFTIFEMGRRAATPGKRMMRLRVVAREGRQLTANAIFARNVMRELEVFLPFTFLFFGGRDEPLTALTTLMVLVWLGVFVFMPIFNRDKLRAGDIVAGTWVIRNPKISLAQDITSSVREDAAEEFQFTSAQLATYGEHELQVLEDVLRSGSDDVKLAVADRIRKRIRWEKGPGETDQDFLDAFYRALRQTLETKMLFGQRKKDKYDTGPTS